MSTISDSEPQTELSAQSSGPLTKGGLKAALQQVQESYYIFIALIVLIIISAIFSPNFLTTQNITNIFKQSATLGIVSLGMLVVILTGGIDLSVGSLVALSGVLAVGLQRDYPLPVAMLAGIAVGVITGGINGLFVAKRQIPPFIATMGMMVIARGLTYVYTNGGPIVITYSSYRFWGRESLGPIPVIVIVWLVLCLAFAVLLRRTTFGRSIIAIGSNPHAVYLSGINVSRHLLAVYTISGVMCAIGGILLTSRLSIGTPILGQQMELDAIAAVVIGGASLSGGRGTVWGTIIGVLILGLISNLLNLMGVSAFYQDIVRGSIILVAVLLKVSEDFD